MKKHLLKVTSTAFALGIALSAQADVEAASPNASVKAQGNGAANLERLNPVEKRISSVDVELQLLSTELANTETLSEEQYDYYEGKLNSLNNRVSASTNQLNAITKKVDDSTEEVINAENTIDEALTNIIEVQELLSTIVVLPEEQPVEEPTVEEPAVEEQPVEEPTVEESAEEEQPVEEPTAEVKIEVVQEVTTE